MDRDRRLSLTVGGFALVALAALMVAILSLSAHLGPRQPHRGAAHQPLNVVEVGNQPVAGLEDPLLGREGENRQHQRGKRNEGEASHG